MLKMRTLLALLLIPTTTLCQEGELTLAELKSFEGRLGKLIEEVIPATVGVRIGTAGGSGVIISEDGWVLTAAHVFRRPGQDGTVTLHDGRVAQAKTMGRMETDDFGVMKITDEGPWPYVKTGRSASLKKGQLCIAVGHPGGVQPGRSAPLRLGRILSNRGQWVRTNAIVDRGDSGGPLFDLDGRVIGIHSRIGMRTTQNMHVPVDHYTTNWKRLTDAEEWDDDARGARWHDGPVLGVRGDAGPNGSRLDRVYSDMPASKAGLKRGDYVVAVNDDKVEGWEDLSKAIRKHKPGDTVKITVRRRGEDMTFEVTLAAKPGQREGQPPAEGEMPVVEEDDDPVAEFVAEGNDVDKAFAKLIRDAEHGVVLVESGGRGKVLGTILTEDGWIVTKLSEVEGKEITCTFEDGEKRDAAVVAESPEYDLVFLKADARDLQPVTLVTTEPWVRGQWVVAAGRDEEPISVGVVSVLPRRLAYRGYLGIYPDMSDTGISIREVVEGTAAEEAKLKAGDVILEVDGKPVKSPEDFRHAMASRDAGTVVEFGVRRGDETLKLEATLRMRPEDEQARDRDSRRREQPRSRRRGRGSWRSLSGSRLSDKRTGFKTVVQHDAVMNADQCGGPLLNADGECCAINIARAARYCTYAVPAGIVKELLAEARKK